MPKEADIQVLVEKDQTIQELRETIEVFFKLLTSFIKFFKDSRAQNQEARTVGEIKGFEDPDLDQQAIASRDQLERS